VPASVATAEVAREARSLPALVPAPVTGEHLSENRIERVIGSRGEAHQLRSLHLREPRLDDSSDEVDAVEFLAHPDQLLGHSSGSRATSRRRKRTFLLGHPRGSFGVI